MYDYLHTLIFFSCLHVDFKAGQLSDLWQVVVSAPNQARQIDKKYGNYVYDIIFSFF